MKVDKGKQEMKGKAVSKEKCCISKSLKDFQIVLA